jgi:hypothetical protein
MAQYNSQYTYSSNLTIRFDVKQVQYITVAGGGGGARPNPTWGRDPENGGDTRLNTTGLWSQGGRSGELNRGGYGGYGNYSYGRNGQINYSGGEYLRAASGYGPYGFGGAGQWRGTSLTGGGGGGGASLATYYRGSNGAVGGQSVGWTIGQGGIQGGTGSRRRGYVGGIYINQTTYDRPAASISANPSSIILGSSTTLTWSTSGDITSVNISEIGNVSTSGSIAVSPSSSGSYILQAINPAYTTTDTVTITVLIPPIVTMSFDNDTIVLGENATLTWSVSGDANQMSIDNGIGVTTLNGYQIVTPTQSVVYTGTASGAGGTGSDTAVLTVLPPPTLSVAGPIVVDYSDDIPFSISATNVPGGISFTTAYVNTNGTQEQEASVTIPGSNGNLVEISDYAYTPVYDNFGPTSVTFLFTANGYGGLLTYEQVTIPINIDQTPDAIDIPSTEDKLRDEEPVITPNVEVTSEQIVVQDIDIPVEIKSDYPIQVEIENGEVWYDVREI